MTGGESVGKLSASIVLGSSNTEIRACKVHDKTAAANVTLQSVARACSLQTLVSSAPRMYNTTSIQLQPCIALTGRLGESHGSEVAGKLRKRLHCVIPASHRM